MKHKPIVETLLNSIKDNATKKEYVNKADACGKSPLAVCAWLSHNSIMEILIQNGADLNSRDNMNNTPLHEAIESENTVGFNLLVNHPNVDISIKNDFGQNAIDVAKAQDNPEMIERLQTLSK